MLAWTDLFSLLSLFLLSLSHIPSSILIVSLFSRHLFYRVFNVCLTRCQGPGEHKSRRHLECIQEFGGGSGKCGQRRLEKKPQMCACSQVCFDALTGIFQFVRGRRFSLSPPTLPFVAPIISWAVEKRNSWGHFNLCLFSLKSIFHTQARAVCFLDKFSFEIILCGP